MATLSAFRREEGVAPSAVRNPVAPAGRERIFCAVPFRQLRLNPLHLLGAAAPNP